MKSYGKLLIFLMLSLMFIGGLMVFTASGKFSIFESHLIKLIFSLFLFMVFLFIPYETYKEFSKPIMLIIIFLLVATLFMGKLHNGARRWIDFGFFQFQPSEFLKLFLIIHLSVLIDKKKELIKDLNKGLIFPLFWVFLSAFLIILQPNVSTAMIVVGASFIVLYVGGAKLNHLLGVGLIVFILAGASVFIAFPHAESRINSYLNHENKQLIESKIALGSGGITGVGIGQSRQSNSFVPEPFGDFIFSIFGEELGFLGSIILLMIYLAIFISGVRIAKSTEDSFGQLLAFGITLIIFLNAIINIGVVSGLLPTTGITLPFVSYGGSSMLMFSIAMAILINISYQNKTKLIVKESIA